MIIANSRYSPVVAETMQRVQRVGSLELCHHKLVTRLSQTLLLVCRLFVYCLVAGWHDSAELNNISTVVDMSITTDPRFNMTMPSSECLWGISDFRLHVTLSLYLMQQIWVCITSCLAKTETGYVLNTSQKHYQDLAISSSSFLLVTFNPLWSQ
jgi:hypothetical protein